MSVRPVVLLLAFLVSCGPHGVDAATEACTRFIQLGSDQEILTDAEVRERAQDIYDLAQASDDETLIDGTRRLLAGATQHDDSLYASGFVDTWTACGL